MRKVRQRRAAAAVFGAAAVVALTAPAPPASAAPAASAASTTVRTGSATAGPYSGNVRALLLGSATMSTAASSGSCTEATLTGSVRSDGGGLSVGGVVFSTGGGPCTGSAPATITGANLPWTGGSIAFDPARTGGRDGTATFAGFSARVVVSLGGATVTCVYGADVVADAYNRDNASRPVPDDDQTQLRLRDAKILKQAGSDPGCPPDGTYNATYRLLGERTAGSGTFDQPLYVTG
ncbi:hypothetical protein [Actinomadura sp. NEAU-AAG7]|uniref:hypothetical protein n=1 Tax=Actinomadura sp. NEAU-AAG7 TaxID=2839640 RepID=UPI001BE436BF|nr:hypothetical protein [Actinomadura sp. NEAU-AAG7]MBT2209484.1 hypothetical protein [Actinomadura sp. NEAU-AAG7]